MPTVAESIEIKASPKKCYDIITDYESYPEFIDGLSGVTVAKKKAASAEVTYEINVVKKITYTLKMTGKPPHRIDWEFVRGDIMKDNQGHWELEEIKKGVTKATYHLTIEFGLLVPGMVTKKLVGKNLPEMLKAFKARIEEA